MPIYCITGHAREISSVPSAYINALHNIVMETEEGDYQAESSTILYFVKFTITSVIVASTHSMVYIKYSTVSLCKYEICRGMKDWLSLLVLSWRQFYEYIR